MLARRVCSRALHACSSRLPLVVCLLRVPLVPRSACAVFRLCRACSVPLFIWFASTLPARVPCLLRSLVHLLRPPLCPPTSVLAPFPETGCNVHMFSLCFVACASCLTLLIRLSLGGLVSPICYDSSCFLGDLCSSINCFYLLDSPSTLTPPSLFAIPRPRGFSSLRAPSLLVLKCALTAFVWWLLWELRCCSRC